MEEIKNNGERGVNRISGAIVEEALRFSNNPC